MLAGKLDRRITILRQMSVGKSALNEAEFAWVPIGRLWASYEPIRDGERLQAAQTQGRATARFQIRHSSRVADISDDDRIEFDGQVYGVTHVKEVGRREGIELTVKASDGQGSD